MTVKLPSLILFCTLLASCGGGGSSGNNNPTSDSPVFGPAPGSATIQNRDSLLGMWIVQGPNDCDDTLSFGNDGTLFSASKDEFVFANYNVVGGETRDALNIYVEYDNGGEDCYGDAENDTGLTIGPLYLEFVGNTVDIYEFPTGGNSLETLLYLVYDPEPIFTGNNNISIESLMPATATAGALTQFQVTLHYQLDQTTKVHLFFNEHHIAGGNSTTIVLQPGEGSETLFLEATPYDWGEDSAYYLYINADDDSTGEPVFGNRFEIPLTTN